MVSFLVGNWYEHKTPCSDFFEALVDSNQGVFLTSDWNFFLKFHDDKEKLREVYNRARDTLIVKSVHEE
jgi:hypothetical protein